MLLRIEFVIQNAVYMKMINSTWKVTYQLNTLVNFKAVVITVYYLNYFFFK